VIALTLSFTNLTTSAFIFIYILWKIKIVNLLKGRYSTTND
jgi:hypothetical protein